MTYLHAGLCLLLLLLLAGALRRKSPSGRRLMVTAAVGLFLWCWPPAAAIFSGTLERHYPARRFPPGDAEAMVVLSGSVYPADASQPQALPGYSTYLRCQHAAWLHGNWKPLPILATGGVMTTSDRPAADVMARVLTEAGVPPSMVWTERASQSTYENAVYSARLLREKGIRRIALVTEAYHLLRAQRCFQKQGLEVVPAPVAHRSERFKANWRSFFPSPGAMLSNEEVLHEWVGVAAYRMFGRI